MAEDLLNNINALRLGSYKYCDKSIIYKAGKQLRIHFKKVTECKGFTFRGGRDARSTIPEWWTQGLVQQEQLREQAWPHLRQNSALKQEQLREQAWPHLRQNSALKQEQLREQAWPNLRQSSALKQEQLREQAWPHLRQNSALK
jgi:hypothetical protein